MTNTVVALIVIGTTVLAAAFFCSLVEAGIRNLSSFEIVRFAQHHQRVSRILLRFQENRYTPAATLSVIVIPAVIVGAVLGSVALSSFSPAVRWATVAGYAYLLAMFGVVAPRALGRRFREPLSFIFSLPLYCVTLLFFPVTFPLALIGRIIDRRQPVNPKNVAAEIVFLAQQAAAGAVISKKQAHLIMRTVEISTFSAADIMVGRADMHPLSDTLSLAEALVEAHLHHHTRFPLTHEGDLDRIIGYVNFKDIVGALRVNPADPTLYGIKRPIESVDAATSLPELLQLLTRGSQHIVIVRGARQRTLGMVTLEDLMETLVGDLEDEYDKPPDFIVPLTDRRFRAGGGVTFSQLKNTIAPQLPDWDLTVNEWISSQTEGKIPEQFSTAYQGLAFTVRRIARGRVFDVIIERTKAPSGNTPVEKEQ
ncbi:MAG: DUF21 domain-containing protein [Chitinispirillaceae bacterium]|nr:DUF21 domain-containing protein [Chitinispirillaceae bacterium]